jgi:hypothetical protein
VRKKYISSKFYDEGYMTKGVKSPIEFSRILTGISGAFDVIKLGIVLRGTM